MNKIRVTYRQHNATARQLQEKPQYNFETSIKQWVVYNEQWSISSHIYLETDGSFKKPFNNSEYIISDNKGNKILYGNDSPQSSPHLQSSYDAEIYAVILGF